MRTKLLSEKIETMRLRPNAPYPREELEFDKECFDHREMIKSWQRAQQRVQLKEVQRG